MNSFGTMPNTNLNKAKSFAIPFVHYVAVWDDYWLEKKGNTVERVNNSEINSVCPNVCQRWHIVQSWQSVLLFVSFFLMWKSTWPKTDLSNFRWQQGTLFCVCQCFINSAYFRSDVSLFWQNFQRQIVISVLQHDPYVKLLLTQMMVSTCAAHSFLLHAALSLQHLQLSTSL